jgi:GrpB-like predicted nucleotidyltransferase (UPF0157 family)
VSEPNIVIREYDLAWQKLFEGLRERLLDILGGLAVAFEPSADAPRHHLYVVTAGGEELRRHLAFRDYLRAHPEEASTYAALKRECVRRFGRDRRAYTDAKGEFVEHILSRSIVAR